jgi:hypothetical protein
MSANMRIPCVVITLFLFAGAAYALPSDQCPKLPSDAGVHWNYQEGPDFSVCNAIRGADGKELFGVYMGNYPSFRPESASAVAHGVVAGIAVDWYLSPDAHDSSLLQTVLDIPGPQPDMSLKSHVWILPQRRSDLPKTFGMLARMRY